MDTFSQRLLLEELRRRQRRNANYSLRAFARDLSLPRTTISDVIQGKRRLSKSSVERLSRRLALENTEVERLVREGKSEWHETRDEITRRTLEDSEFELVSNWFFYAILNLALLKTNRASAAWIAGRLGIETSVARAALRKLTSLGMIAVEEGRMIRTTSPLQTKRDVPSRYVREQHRQFLQLAEQSLENVAVDLRDISTTTMAVDSKKLPRAKEMILKFRNKLADFLSDDGEANDSVYTLGVQLFPARQHPETSK